jgi:hypothetical protein
LNALSLLSDGAFKLYLFLCLRAERRSGTISISYAETATALGKSRRSVNTYFDELRDHGVCEMQAAINQHGTNAITICDNFWPYTRATSNPPTQDQSVYFRGIKSLLSARACVRCSFSAGDQKLSASYFHRGITLEQLEHAIALGCSRKYLSWLNGADYKPIVSLHYFADLVEEACDEDTPTGYRDYLLAKLKKLESSWLERRGETHSAPVRKSLLPSRAHQKSSPLKRRDLQQ